MPRVNRVIISLANTGITSHENVVVFVNGWDQEEFTAFEVEVPDWGLHAEIIEFKDRGKGIFHCIAECETLTDEDTMREETQAPHVGNMVTRRIFTFGEEVIVSG